MMPILNPEKPKRVTLTMANTLFGAFSGVRPVNWGLIIHEIMTRGISQIGKKPSYISPFFMHLYAYHGCTTVDEDDKLITAREEYAYKLQLVPHESSKESDPPIPEAPPSSPGSPPESFEELALRLLPLRAIILLPHIVHLSPRTLSDPAGLRLRPHGKTWICPRGGFWTTPFNGCMLTWRIFRPNTTSWSILPREKIKP